MEKEIKNKENTKKAVNSTAKKTTQNKSTNNSTKKQSATVKPKKENNNINNDELLKMVKSLENRLNKELEKNKKYEEKDKSKFENCEKFLNDEDVVVVNLCDSEFCLSTEGFGNGKRFFFNGFGYQREIPYSELRECFYSNTSFFQSGRLYIEDERVVKKFKLSNYYKNMFNYNDIVNMSKLSSRELYDRLVSTPKAETDSINRNNEPVQIDILYSHILKKVENKEFSVDQIAQIERAYYDIKNEKINISEELEKKII